MNLLVLGASGRTGTEVVTHALARGHHVQAFVHDPRKLSVTDPNLTMIAGDALVPADLRYALFGQDAVISTIGSHRVSDTLISGTTESLIEAMDAMGVRRIVMMSTFVVAPNYRPSGADRLFHPLAKAAAADMAAGEALLRDSDLDWTVVRATRLVNGPGPGARVVAPDEHVTHKFSIARPAVANFLLSVLGDPSFIRQALMITGQP